MITISVFGEATRSHYSLRPEDWAPATPRTNKRCFINSFHFYPILSLLLDFLTPLISNHTPLFVMSSLALDVVDISSSSRTASLGHQPNTPSPISTLSSTSASHGVHRDVSAELLERGRVKHRKHGDVPYPLKAISMSKWLHRLLSIQTLTFPFCFRQGYCCTWNDRQSLRLAYSSRLHSSSFRAPTEACTRYWMWYRLLDHYGSTTVEGNFSIPFAHISSLPLPDKLISFTRVSDLSPFFFYFANISFQIEYLTTFFPLLPWFYIGHTFRRIWCRTLPTKSRLHVLRIQKPNRMGSW